MSARLVLILTLATPRVFVVTMPFLSRFVPATLLLGAKLLDIKARTLPVLLETRRPEVGDTPQPEIRPKDELAR